MAPTPRKPLMPHTLPIYRKQKRNAPIDLRAAGSGIVALLLVGLGLFSLPGMLESDIKLAATEAPKPPFPVNVDPINETITEDPAVDALFGESSQTLGAAASLASTAITWIANAVTKVPGYEQIAGSDIVFVDIKSGYRQEEVARAFGMALGWTRAEQDAFLKQVNNTDPELLEGEFVPGTYMVSSAASASYVQELLADRYERDIASRYSPEAEQVLPLEDVLTIASLLQRETRDPSEMRLISGIIWNRLWSGMNLQIDATLQYAKASKGGTKTWWPVPKPADKYIKSEYNTYQNEGLPPGPISNPSTEAILAALNPKKTDCIFYFHDRKGEMFCSPDYAGHVRALKKSYGQGK
ncbi:MAG: endolytic transglycosylase MltG [Patescibacteria group bacterium]